MNDNRLAWLQDMKPGTPVYWKDPIGLESGVYIIESVDKPVDSFHSDVEVVLVSQYDEHVEHVVPSCEISLTENFDE